jgi:hypothetical protein
MRLGHELSVRMGTEISPAELRAGIAVMRGLLADVLAGCDIVTATEAFDAHLARWR